MTARIRGSAWQAIRKHVAMRGGYRCALCNLDVSQSWDYRCDHIRPLREGGTNDPANLRCVCVGCHNKLTTRQHHRRAGLPRIGRDGLPVE